MLFRACNMHAKKRQRESGGIGRRARLRIWYRKVWGFESPLSHHKKINRKQPAPTSSERRLTIKWAKPQRYLADC